MKPITLRLFNEISDAYFYMGKLFILTNDGFLKFIDNDRFFDLYLSGDDNMVNHYLKKIFFGNDELPSYGNYLNKKNKFRGEFIGFWDKLKDRSFEFTVIDNHLETVCALPENDPLDFVIYAQRAYLANRDGLFECMLNIEGASVVPHFQGFERVFDSKSININPRAGRVLVSTKSDGLFAGSIDSLKDRLTMKDRQISHSSVRTGWANYDFVNYSSPVTGDYFHNETQDEKSEETAKFSIDDGVNQNKKISNIGVSSQNLTELFVGRSKNERIVFTFNSLTNSFSVSDSGAIYFAKFQEQTNFKSLPAELREFKDLRFDMSTLGKPLSAYTIGNGGTVYEFFDQVMLLKGGTIVMVSEIECKQIRTFASSKWYKNILLTLADEYLEIHSVHPYS